MKEPKYLFLPHISFSLPISSFWPPLFFFVPTLLPHIFFPPLCANPVGVGQYQFAGIACNSMEIGGAVWNRAPLTLGPWRFFCVWRGDLSGCGGRSRAP